jgi:hypothetical protein
MSDQPAMPQIPENPRDVYIACIFPAFREAFDGGHGMFLDKGTSLFETLDGISAEMASRQVNGGCATLAAHVAHVNFYCELTEHWMLTISGTPSARSRRRNGTPAGPPCAPPINASSARCRRLRRGTSCIRSAAAWPSSCIRPITWARFGRCCVA